jgi:hypothetical protein
MKINLIRDIFCRLYYSRLIILAALLLHGSRAVSQTSPATSNYSRLNGFGLFGEYSNDSSHMLIGVSRNRKLLDFGGSYTRRLLLNRFMDGQYMAEIRPVMLESDPITDQTTVIVSPPPSQTYTNDGPLQEACHAFTSTSTSIIQGVTYTENFTQTCPGRRWTYGAGLSPIGFKLNFLPRRRIQPVLTGLGGLMISTQQIPVSDASRFNFTFEFGGGLEFYRSTTRSIRVEWRYHHISNDFTGNQNPGIDSGLFQVTYAFGH